ncbi:MAG: SGNH/GDSL hydrolase family protein [Lachnospiraceae bacterium]|nr:SGNH/GDSL hydrolase family protein [Lachnospiraceae bacterium]
MGKKRVLTLILILMIVVCCVTEAVIIGQLKTENTAIKADIQALVEANEVQSTSIDEINGQLTATEQAKIPQIYLPEDIYVCAGLTMELYNDCVAVGINHEDYEFYWECEIGDCMEDKWRIHPSESEVGNYILSLHVYDLKLQELTSASTTVHVVPHVFAQEPTGNLQVLTIGDSLSAGTEWIAYTRYLSDCKISHVGTLGVEEGMMHEGRKGITAADYLNGTLFGTKIESPFINPATDEFDWAYYKESNGVDPNVVQIFLGTNGLAMDPVPNANDIFALIDKISEADPNVQIILIEPIYPANQDGMARQQNQLGYEALHGMWAMSREHMVYNLIRELDVRADDYANVTVVPAAVMFDRAYGFAQENIRVNPQSDLLESVPVEGIHPSDQGYLQIGDAIYSTLCYMVYEQKIETTHEEETGE